MEWLLFIPLLGFVWPWQSVDPETQIPIDTANETPYGPYLPPNWDSGEFGPLQPVANVVTNVVKNTDRILQKQNADPTATKQTSSGLWSRVTGAASSTGDFLSSTLTKVIIIVAITAVAALFIMSFVQAKGAQFAK